MQKNYDNFALENHHLEGQLNLVTKDTNELNASKHNRSIFRKNLHYRDTLLQQQELELFASRDAFQLYFFRFFKLPLPCFLIK